MSNKPESRKDEIIALMKKNTDRVRSGFEQTLGFLPEGKYETVATEIEKLFEGEEQPKVELIFKKEREDGVSCCQVECAYYFTRSENCCAGWNNSGSIIEVCQGYKPVKQYRPNNKLTEDT